MLFLSFSKIGSTDGHVPKALSGSRPILNIKRLLY
jgi:hypothetical protein